jgi:hypothetical protein
MNQFVFNEPPDDAGHLVAVHLDDRILDFDLRHSLEPPFDSRHRSAVRGCGGLYSIDFQAVKAALVRGLKSYREASGVSKARQEERRRHTE